jgi:hypothetical protein
MYRSSDSEGRLAILGSLKAGSERPQESSVWQTFLKQAASESDARLRRAAAGALGAQPAGVAAAVVGPLLSDENAETRSQAAGVVLSVMGAERVVTSGSHEVYVTDFGELTEELGMRYGVSSLGKKPAVTNAPPASPRQIAAWHEVLLQKAGPTPDALTAAAVYATGPSNANLPMLQGALEGADKETLARLSRSAALAAILPRLPWPDGKPVVESLCRSRRSSCAWSAMPGRRRRGSRSFCSSRPAFGPASNLPRWRSCKRACPSC